MKGWGKLRRFVPVRGIFVDRPVVLFQSAVFSVVDATYLGMLLIRSANSPSRVGQALA